MKKYIKNNFNIIFLITMLLILSTGFYWTFDVYFAPDSCWYYYLSLIFNGKISIMNWWDLRGFTLPLYLSFFNLFGDNLTSMKIALYIPYILCIVFELLFIMKNFNNKKDLNKNFKLFFLFCFLIILNPIIIGYSHTVLTEILMPFFSIITLYVSDYWYDFHFEKKQYHIIKLLGYILFFSFSFIFSWYLKQPYFPIIFLILFISSVLSIINRFSLRNILIKVLVIVLSFLSLFFVSKIWNGILSEKSVNTGSTSKTLTGSLLGVFSKNYILNSDKSTEELLIYDIYDNSGNLIDVQSVNNNMSSSVIFYVKQYFIHPVLVFSTLKNNYLATINVYNNKNSNGSYKAGNELAYNDGENRSLAMYIFSNGFTHWSKFYLNDHNYEEYVKNYQYAPYMEQYVADRNVSNNLHVFFELLFPIYSLIFKVSFLITPILFLLYFILFLIKKEKKYMVLCTIFGSSFGHIFFHAATGAIIDRYAYVAFQLVIIGFIIIILNNTIDLNLVIKKEVKYEKR